VQRTGEGPASIRRGGLDDPPCGLVATNHAQAALAQDATKLVRVTAAQGTSVENRITDLRHRAPCLASDLLVQPRWILALGWCYPNTREATHQSGVKVSSFAFQSMRDGRVKPTVNEVVTPSEFELSAQLFMPRIVPLRAHHAARDGVHLGNEEVGMELARCSVVALLPVPNQHDALRVEAELVREEVKRSQLLLRRDVGLG